MNKGPSLAALEFVRQWCCDQTVHQRIAAAHALDALIAKRITECADIWANDPQWDGTDAAHPAWWRGSDRGCEAATQILTDALNGKDDGHGVIGHAPLETLRRRLLAIADHREVLPP